MIAYACAQSTPCASGRDRDRYERGFTISICRRMRYSRLVSAAEDRRAVFAIALTLSDRIVRLSGPLVIRIRPYKLPRSFTKPVPFAGNGQARLARSRLRLKPGGERYDGA